MPPLRTIIGSIAAAFWLVVTAVPALAQQDSAQQRVGSGRHWSGIGLQLSSYGGLIPALELRPVPWLRLNACGFRYKHSDDFDQEYSRTIAVEMALAVGQYRRIRASAGIAHYRYQYRLHHQGVLDPDGGQIYSCSRNDAIIRTNSVFAAEASVNRLHLRLGWMPIGYIDLRKETIYPGTDAWGPPPWGNSFEQKRGLQFEPGAIEAVVIFFFI